jgi:serine protease AprX
VMPQADATGRGAGMLNVRRASLAAAPAATAPILRRGTGTGTLEGARGGAYATQNGVALVGERDIFGAAWNGSVWAAASANQTAWVGGRWLTHDMTGTCWCGSSYAGSTSTWSRSTWRESSWTRSSWSSGTWLRSSWSSAGWTNGGW